MKVEFWVDPLCPFCWVTSRWIREVAPHRDLDIDWRSISLLVKNQPEEGSRYHDVATTTHALLRVMESVRAAGQAEKLDALYTEFGRHIHSRKEFDFDVAGVLVGVGLDASHADAVADVAWDVAIQSSMKEGLGLTGDDVGTPIIAIEAPHGKVGIFGPVITNVLDLEPSLKLWDAYVAMVSTEGFFEIKRTRSEAPVMPPEDRI